MYYFIQCLFIVFPIFAAGLIFIYVLQKGFFSQFNKPVDLNLTIFGKRLFGDNKTFRGFLIMPAATLFVVMCMSAIFKLFDIDENHILFDYSFDGWYKALIFGAAYAFGELPNSFVKRQLNIEPGMRAKRLYMRIIFDIIDKMDSLVLCGVAVYFVYNIDIKYVFGAVTLGFICHYVTDLYMIKLRLKNQ